MGIGESSPASKVSIKGNLSVGDGYSNEQAPADGAIIKGAVGIGTTEPKNKLDIEGGLSLREGAALNLSNGANNNVALNGNYSFYRITGPTADFSISGIVPVSGADGQIVTLVNTTNQKITISNLSNNSNVANRIKTLTGSDLAGVVGYSSVTLQYNKTDNNWFVTSTQNFALTTGAVATGDIKPGTNSAITVTNGTGKAVGTGDVTVDVAINALNTKGVVPGPTNLNNNQAYLTDNNGNPAWSKIPNTHLSNPSVTINAGTGLSGGGNVSLGSSTTLNIANTGVTAGTYNNVTVNAQGQVTSGSNAAYLTGNQNITLSGDVTGSGTTTIATTIANNAVTSGKIANGTILAEDLNSMGAGNGQVLKWNGTVWAPATDNNGGGTVTNIATGSGLTGGPITGTGTISIANGGITNAMLANSAITVNTSGVGLSTIGSPVSLGGTITINSNATSANTTNTIVSRDASGNFSAGLITANLNGQWQRIDDRTIAPNEISSGYAKFGFTSWGNNNTSPYADFLHLRSYTDASGGNDNLIMFRKDQIGMRIYQQAWNSATPYSTYKDVAFTTDLTNSINGTTNYVSKFTSTNTIGNSQIFDNGTNVGIGTTAPASKLEIGSGGSLRVNGASYEGGGQIQSSGIIRFANGSSAQAIYTKQISVSDSWSDNDSYTQTNGIYSKGNLRIGGSSPTVYADVTNKRVGIGTVSPTEALHVAGKIRMVDGNQATGNVMTSDANGTGTWQTPKYNAYKIPQSGGTAQWVKLGTLTISQGGKSAFFKIISNAGYNASNNQNFEVYLRFKTSNASSVDANGFAGDASYWYTGSNGSFASSGKIKLKANAAGASATAYDLFVQFAAYTGDGSFYTVETTEGTWVHSGATGQADPGAASSTVLIAPLVNPISVGVPIGSIIAWHKSGSGMPSLPNGWVECSGGTVSDGDSPIYGMAIPNLNGTFTTESGGTSAAGRFLRGSTSSGTLTADQTNSVTEMLIEDNGGGQASQRTIPDTGGWSAAGYNYYTTASNDGIKLRKKGVETKPGAMTVVWIMRVK